MPLSENNYTKYGLSILTQHMRRAEPHIPNDTEFLNKLTIDTGDHFKVTSAKYGIDRDYGSLYAAITDLENIPNAQTIWHIRDDGTKKVVFKRPA